MQDRQDKKIILPILPPRDLAYPVFLFYRDLLYAKSYFFPAAFTLLYIYHDWVKK